MPIDVFGRERREGPCGIRKRNRTFSRESRSVGPADESDRRLLKSSDISPRTGKSDEERFLNSLERLPTREEERVASLHGA